MILDDEHIDVLGLLNKVWCEVSGMEALYYDEN